MTWHGDNKRHSDVQAKNKLKETLRQPMIKKDFDYFMRKFNLTPQTDKRRKVKGQIVRGVVVRSKGRERTLVLNARSNIVDWHEIGHIIAEEITKKEAGIRSGGSILSREYIRGASPFYESLMILRVENEELNNLLKFIENQDFMSEAKLIENDIQKLKNRIPPYDKIPETEMTRIIKDSEDQLKQFNAYLTFTSKPQEVFANFFAFYQINRVLAISLLPRLYAIWGDSIDNYMREA